MLLNNPLQPAPTRTGKTKTLSTHHAHKPTGGIWTTGVGLKARTRRKNIFRKKEKTPSTKGEVN